MDLIWSILHAYLFASYGAMLIFTIIGLCVVRAPMWARIFSLITAPVMIVVITYLFVRKTIERW